MGRKYGFVVKNNTTISDFNDCYKRTITKFEVVSANCFKFHCNDYEYTALHLPIGEVEGVNVTCIHLKCEDEFYQGHIVEEGWWASFDTVNNSMCINEASHKGRTHRTERNLKKFMQLCIVADCLYKFMLDDTQVKGV